VGDHAVELLVTDSGGLTDTQSFTITVANVNDAPEFTSTPVTTATQDEPYTHTVTVDDPDLAYGDVLTITAPTLPSWLTFTQTGEMTATLSGTPANADVGDHAVELLVTDSGGLFAEQVFTLTVTTAPLITSADHATFVVGAAGTFTVTAVGVPTPTLAYSGTLPSGVSFNDNGDGTATLAGTPALGAAGVYSLTLTASNGVRPDAVQHFTLTVNTRVYLPLVLRNAQ
jgi:hypothetical protein